MLDWYISVSFGELTLKGKKQTHFWEACNK